MKIGQFLISKKLNYLLVFLLFFILLAWLQFNYHLGDPDGFYHAKMAILLSRGELWRSLPWMQFTTLTLNFTDHHFLYHLLLVPFVKLGNPIYAVKLATIFFGALFFTAFYWLIYKQGNKHALAFTFLLIFSSSFIFRLSLIKANSLSLIWLLLIFYCLRNKKVWLLAVLNFFYVWLYGGWLLGIMAAGLNWLITNIRGQHKKWWQYIFFRAHNKERGSVLFGASLLGAVLGLIINPYWPHNILFYWQQVVEIGLKNYAGLVNVGGEWSGLPWQDFMPAHGYGPAILAIVLLSSVKYFKRWQTDSWLYLSFAVISSILVLKSQRYVELSAPLIVLAAATIAWQSFPKWSWKGIGDNLVRQRGRADKFLKYCVIIMIVALTPVISYLFVRDLQTVRYKLILGPAIDAYQEEASWLSSNIPHGEIVLHSDWDEWPMLFNYNADNYYIVGLDPTFMYLYSPELYNLYADITQGRLTTNLAERIEADFKTRYILVSKDHLLFTSLLSNDTDFRLIHRGPMANIYMIVENNGQ